MSDTDELTAFESMNQQVAQQASDGMDAQDMTLPCGRTEPWHVRILLKDACFNIVPRVRYTFEVDGQTRVGYTDDGIVDEEVSAQASGGTLTVWSDGDDAPPYVWELQFAPLEPLALDEGVGVRMLNLGLIDDVAEVSTAGQAMQRRTLQSQFEQPITGQVDGPIRETLQSLYSSDTRLSLEDSGWKPPADLWQNLEQVEALIDGFGRSDG